MASTYSPLKIELITTGEQSATWGTTTNVNLGTAIEEAITGSADVDFSADADITLTLTSTNGTQTARNLRLRLFGTITAARTLTVPAISEAVAFEKQYIVKNECAYPITIKPSGGTGVSIPPAMSAIVFSNGTTIESANIYSTSVVTPALAATDAVFLNALPVTSGGTGVTTSTGTGAGVHAVSPTLTTPALGTPSSGVLTSCTGLPLSTGITGTLPVANGGTGVTTSTGTGNVVLSVSPTLTGSPIAPTQTAGTNDTTIATTAFTTTALTNALQVVYPIGSIYTSTVSTNPNTLFGFGTWVAFGAGRVMIGNGGGYSAGATGGSADAVVVSHSHTASSSSSSTSSVTDPGHTHTITNTSSGENGDGRVVVGNDTPQSNYTVPTATTGISVSTSTSTSTTVNTAGVSGTNANLQPYVVVYMWNRTA
jgi:hypothetical protein